MSSDVVVEPYWNAPVCHPELAASFLRAEPASTSFTSRQVRSELAVRTRAATPETMAVAAEVPPKSSAYRS